MRSIVAFVRKFSIAQKLVLSYWAIGVATVLTLSIIFYFACKEALLNRTFAQLSSVNVLKAQQIEEHFINRKKNLDVFINNDDFRNTFTNFLKSGQGDSRVLRNFQIEHQYADMLLIDKGGNVIYTSNEYSFLNTHLQKNNRSLIEFLTRCRNGYQRYDFSGADTSHSHCTILIGYPLKDKSGYYMGTVLFQKFMQPIEKIVLERTGMGQSGESYLVGNDYRMRTTSRFFPHTPPLHITVNTPASQTGFKNGEGHKIIADYRGVPVLSVFRKLSIDGIDWVLISEIDLEEAMKPVYIVRNYMVYVGLALVMGIVIVTYFLAHTISVPIKKLRNVVRQVSQGDLPTEKICITSNTDEVGEMQKAINDLTDGLQRITQFATEIGQSQFQTQFSPLSKHDVLGAALLQMRNNLIASQEKEKYFLRQRSAALLEGQEQERKRIARELHDGLGQLLTAIKFQIGALESGTPHFSQVKALLTDAITEVRRISNNAMPTVLIDFGLDAALRKLCSTTTALSNTTIEYQYLQDCAQSDISFEVSIGLYRIAQEAVNNVLKHAKATHCKVLLVEGETVVTLKIEDEGCGFDYDTKHAGDTNGLKNMKERTQLLGGTFSLTTSPTTGTRIEITIQK